MNRAAFPPEAATPVQYGPRVKSVAVYRGRYQRLPFLTALPPADQERFLRDYARIVEAGDALNPVAKPPTGPKRRPLEFRVGLAGGGST